MYGNYAFADMKKPDDCYSRMPSHKDPLDLAKTLLNNLYNPVT